MQQSWDLASRNLNTRRAAKYQAKGWRYNPRMTSNLNGLGSALTNTVNTIHRKKMELAHDLLRMIEYKDDRAIDLIHRNIDLTVQNKEGDRALDLAIYANNVDIVKAILNRPDIDDIINLKNEKFDNWRPLNVALQRKNPDIIKLLQDKGAIKTSEAEVEAAASARAASAARAARIVRIAATAPAPTAIPNNIGDPTLSRSVVASATAPHNIDDPTTVSNNAANDPEIVEANKGLAPGWQAYKSDSGEIYYYKNKQSTYYRPEAPVGWDVEATSKGELVYVSKTNNRIQSEKPQKGGSTKKHRTKKYKYRKTRKPK
jgi:Ankyrin repeats (3 copies)